MVRVMPGSDTSLIHAFINTLGLSRTHVPTDEHTHTHTEWYRVVLTLALTLALPLALALRQSLTLILTLILARLPNTELHHHPHKPIRRGAARPRPGRWPGLAGPRQAPESGRRRNFGLRFFVGDAAVFVLETFVRNTPDSGSRFQQSPS